ncbi:zinc ribbon domain-containing protein [Natronorubrum halophilum]|uniref:zinc ribbon domain-containing protein n=1 Tax=Natronorubrum halophilum TaxID=1702106 RepID=UPI0010C19935|nr:zinc ribbon domain-containing protein [Natronorubrum halophilum]
MRSTRLQQQIDDLVAQGWTLEDEDRDRVVMVDREFGSVGSHILVALLTIWWTMGIGNVLWGAYNYVSNSQRRVLWEDTTGCPSCGADVAVDSAYCPACGDDLERSVESAAADENGFACPACEAVVTEGSRYCPACGTKLADAMEPSE